MTNTKLEKILIYGITIAAGIIIFLGIGAIAAGGLQLFNNTTISPNFWQLKTSGDWKFISMMVLTIGLCSWLLYLSIKERNTPQRGVHDVLQSLLATTGSVSGVLLLILAAFTPARKLTLNSVKYAVQMNTISCVVSGIVAIIALTFLIWLNRIPLSKNFWYYFILAAPIIWFEAQLYRAFVTITAFLTVDSGSYAKMLDFFKLYNVATGGQINSVMLNRTLTLLIQTALGSVAILLVIGGGMLIVWTKEKAEAYAQKVATKTKPHS